MKNVKVIIGLIVVALMSCENQDVTYSDYDYQAVYFGSQYPVRTLELGEDLYVDNSLDNQYKIAIKATLSGTRDNQKNVVIDFVVDESLCNNLYFSDTSEKIEPMPSKYYELASDQITISSGNILGGVEVKLTDAFFADPKCLTNTYVIPLKMTNVQNADSILEGKDYVLYCVKYINPWQGNYLRRGVDQITANGLSTSTSVRHEQYVEDDEIVSISTNSLTVATLPLSINDNQGNAVEYDLVMTFDKDSTCTVSGNSTVFDITGTGKFVSKGEKESFGGYDRSAIYLDYNVTFKNLNMQYATKDTLVVRDRGLAPEYFTVVSE